MNIKVSIIIATFNAAKTLPIALKSVKDQSFQEWECIIIDGASTDGTIDIIKEFANNDSRFRYISEPDRGVYDAFNKGWKIAKGEWIQYLGDDDTLTINGISELIKEEDEKTDVLNGHCYVKKIDGKEKPCFSKGIRGCHQGKLMRRSVLEKFNGFDMKYKILADLDLMLRLEDAGVAVKVVDTFVAYFSMEGMSQELSGFYTRIKERYDIYCRYSFAIILKNVIVKSIYEIGSIIYRKISRRIKQNK